MMQNRSNPVREVLDELYRVMASNRFIFTHGPTYFAIGIVLGPIPLLVYLAAWSVLLTLALAFERPYQLLRKILPYGNWPPHLAAIPVRAQAVSVIAAIFLIVIYAAFVFYSYKYLFSFTSDPCMGSVACILVRSVF